MDKLHLSELGNRELRKYRDILSAWLENGLPSDFSDDEVEPMFNACSGNLFLVNSGCQVAMLNDGKLESFYSLSYGGEEGFAKELYESFKNGYIDNYQDLDQLKDILTFNNLWDEANEVEKYIADESEEE